MKHILRSFISAAFVLIAYSTFGQTTTITYDTLTSEGNSSLTPAVSATNMNILYQGLDNPVQITVPGTYDQAIIECSGGKISGNNGYYIVKPVSNKEVIISVYTVVKGKFQDTTQFKFRVKKVPTPEIIWAGKLPGDTIVASAGAASPLIPRMYDFDFDVYCILTSFDISYTNGGRTGISGNQIPSDIAREIRALPSGTIVRFDNVKVLVPGGDTRFQSAFFVVK